MTARAAPPAILVDARNVLRSTWPNLTERAVLAGADEWSRRHGGRAVVVFDGTAPGGVVGVTRRGGAVVVGTGSRESADDWLARTAARLRRRRRPFWLATSDRELRERAGTGAGRIVGGGTLARELRALEDER